jgi:hypothetical protein
MEGQMTAIINNGYESTLPHITGNVVFWARSDAVVINKERFDAMTPEQQGWLLSAADTSRDAQVAKMHDFEDEAVGRACRSGITFAQATDAELAALRAAVEPVYEDLRADPATSQAIDEIKAMKTDGPRQLTCQPGDLAGAPASPDGVATPIDGTWLACPTADDIIAAGGDRQESVDNDGCHTMVLDRGAYGPGGSYGSYEVKGDQIVITQSNGELFEFGWSLYQDELTLGLPANPEALSPAPQRAVVYERQDD